MLSFYKQWFPRLSNRETASGQTVNVDSKFWQEYVLESRLQVCIISSGNNIVFQLQDLSQMKKKKCDIESSVGTWECKQGPLGRMLISFIPRGEDKLL